MNQNRRAMGRKAGQFRNSDTGTGRPMRAAKARSCECGLALNKFGTETHCPCGARWNMWGARVQWTEAA